MFLIFDTETTGLPKNWNLPYTDTDNWPRCIQIAWQLHDEVGKLVEAKDFIVYPDGFDIPYKSEEVHGISTDLAKKEGKPIQEVLNSFNEALKRAKFIVGQNVEFDLNIIGNELLRANYEKDTVRQELIINGDKIHRKFSQEYNGNKLTKNQENDLKAVYFYLKQAQNLGKSEEIQNKIEEVKEIFNKEERLEENELINELENFRIKEYYKDKEEKFKPHPYLRKGVLDTMSETTANLCELPGGYGGKFKYPTLTELHEHLFGEPFAEAHNATADVEATTRSFFELVRRRIFTTTELQKDDSFFKVFEEANPTTIQPIGLKHANLKQKSQKLKELLQPKEKVTKKDIKEGLEQLADTSFVHLHNHTQYTVLQSTISIKDLVAKTAEFNLPAVALTDTGNMMGAFLFEQEISKYNKKLKKEREKAEEEGIPFHKTEITPIIGCEFHVCEDHTNKSARDDGYQIVFLAKNKNGYHNISKMASIAFTEGKYYVPRIDKKVVEQYKDDIIVLSGNLYGEIPNKILNIGENQAEEALIWWKEMFGDDFYLEIMRHGQEDENRVNEVLLKFADKHDVKLVATNNTFYVEQKDAEAQDILLCIKDGETVETPKGRGRGFRFGLPNDNYYYRSPSEMKELFADLPEAIENTIEIANKCERYTLASDILLPAFDIPEEFQDPLDLEDNGKRGENNYLRHLTYEGAKSRYGEITDEIKERLDFELETIKNTGYPGYFLIVQDFCHAAREMGVLVGPGRGSAAGSAVAYCTKITNVDPLKYDLLFERFLNPDRISMPDIDIDFDDEGRDRIINWVIEKYGSNQVAQIITYGTMAAKSSIRDTARVLNLPLSDADRLAKLIPDTSLDKIFNLTQDELEKKLKGNTENIAMANEILKISEGNDLQAEVLKNAQRIEGNVRNTGIHACGVIITPKDITEFVPVALAKDSDMYCTQYDNSVVESAGLLKMDFLGLKTLTILRDAVAFVKETQGIDLDIDAFPLDDPKTFELFQRGETIGIFQYESPGMQKYMRELKPTNFADLIAMNALYRPGPIEYIPDFIKRKNGEQEITYDLEDAKEYLEETYGITVYQEQVMLLSQKLADFTKGEADQLRKAMGKKDRDLIDQLKPKFIAQGNEKGHEKKILEKIWHDWEAFASYAFNKSHSTCYAWIAYQTAYLKANYPAEFMASVLSNNMNDIKQVSFFMNECKRMGLPVLGPDVNESNFKFTVNKGGAVRFGLGAIKGVGEAPVEAIVNERKENGTFTDIFDLTKRIDLKKCNKKAFESLVLSGAFDSFTNIHRAQYFVEENNRTFLNDAIKFGANYQEGQNSNQISLFGEATGVESPAPRIPHADHWSTLQKLKQEKEVIGIYISGHPLDDYRLDINSFCRGDISHILELEKHVNKDFTIPAIITEVEHRFTRKGDPFGTITIEDYEDSTRLFFFREDYGKFKPYMIENAFIYLKGKVQAKRWKENEFEFKVNKIDFLSKLREETAKSLEIKIPLRLINQSLIENLDDLCQNNKGELQMNFVIDDDVNKMNVSLVSRSSRIDANSQVLSFLDEMQLKYRLT